MGHQQAGGLCSPARGACAAQGAADASLRCSAAAGAAAQPDAGQQPARAPLPQVRPILCLLTVATGWRNREFPLRRQSGEEPQEPAVRFSPHVLLDAVCCASRFSFGRYDAASADGHSEASAIAILQLRPAAKERALSGTTCCLRQAHRDLHGFCRFELPPQAKPELETTHRHFYADKPTAARSLHPEQHTAPDRKHFIHAGEACLGQHSCRIPLRHSVNSRLQLM